MFVRAGVASSDSPTDLEILDAASTGRPRWLQGLGRCAVRTAMRDVDPEDIDISVIGDKLTIRGAIRAEAEVANGISMLTVPRAKVVKPKAIKVKTK